MAARPAGAVDAVSNGTARTVRRSAAAARSTSWHRLPLPSRARPGPPPPGDPLSRSTTAAPAAARTDPAGADDGWDARQITAVATVAVCGVLVSLTRSLLIPVLPAIQVDPGSSTGGTQWLPTSTLVAGADTGRRYRGRSRTYGTTSRSSPPISCPPGSSSPAA